MAHVTVRGARLYYEERGSGTPIVGVHGAGSSAVFWEDAAERLSGLGRAIVYDRRGSWRSDRPDEYEITSVPEHADDLLELLRALDAEPAILIGRSYGGTIALDLALRRPDAVLALVLLEAGPIGLAPEYDEWFDSLRARLEETVATRGVDAVGEVTLRDVLGAWEELPDVWRDVFTANSPALLAEVRGGEALSDGCDLGELQAPTLIVGAEASPEPLQRCTEALEAALPQAQTARVAGDHAIDPAGPEVTAFVRQVLAGARSGAA